MSIKRISLVWVGVLSGISIHAQDTTYTSPQGIEFILIKPGSMVVGKFQPTVNRGGMGGFGGPPPPGQGTAPVSRPAPVRLPESDYQLAEELAKKDAMPGLR